MHAMPQKQTNDECYPALNVHISYPTRNLAGTIATHAAAAEPISSTAGDGYKYCSLKHLTSSSECAIIHAHTHQHTKDGHATHHAECNDDVAAVIAHSWRRE